MAETEPKSPETLNVFENRDLYKINLESLLKKPPEMVDFQQFGFDGDILERFSGTPIGSKLIKAGAIIYRHYSTQEAVKQIDQQKKIVSGRVPYAQVAPRIRVYWNDLCGIFITKPEYKPEDVGVSNSTDYVDFGLPFDLPLVQLEIGIILVPSMNGSRIELPIRINSIGKLN
jgi:hypothetical protein